MAYEILAEGADITTMDVRYAPNVTKKYNAKICEELGITCAATVLPVLLRDTDGDSFRHWLLHGVLLKKVSSKTFNRV